MRRLPYLTRQDIANHRDALLDERLPRRALVPVSTGGTTSGMPLSLFWSRATQPQEDAFVWRGWNSAGVEAGDRRVVLRGHVVTRQKKGVAQCWMYNPVDRRLIFSCFRLSQEDLAVYAEKLREFRPAVIQAYPSSLYILALFLRRNGIRIPSLKCVLTSSEPLYDHQREVIEDQLGVRAFDHYGNSERTMLAMQCPRGSYHVIPEYGIFELIGRGGEPVREEGEPGEVITTGFLNRAMPLIRYQTDDVCYLRKGSCSCGRETELLDKIHGRKQDFFVDPSGAPIPAAFLVGPLMPFQDRVNAYQYVQGEPGRVLLRIDVRGGLTDAEEESIRREFTELYPDFGLGVETVGEIPRTKAGKFSYLVQNLPLDFNQ